ncbi:hypothetical protein HQ545_00485, partial [Candidatus Woesearchaeota archaeon]|nr:hypothetical protein [Candidatus Woesearchaeota archaeon]
MTLIVAINCKEGIVVASDSQQTSGSAVGLIRRTGIRKIKQLTPTALIASAGHVDVIQDIERNLEERINTTKIQDIAQLEEHTLKITFQVCKDKLDRYKAYYGEEVGREKAEGMYAALFVGKDKKDAKICCIFENGDCLVQDDYEAIGIGDGYAKMILGAHGEKVKEYSLDLAKTLAYRVVDESIKIGAYGMGHPIKMWILPHKEKELLKELNETEIDKLREQLS